METTRATEPAIAVLGYVTQIAQAGPTSWDFCQCHWQGVYWDDEKVEVGARAIVEMVDDPELALLRLGREAEPFVFPDGHEVHSASVLVEFPGSIGAVAEKLAAALEGLPEDEDHPMDYIR